MNKSLERRVDIAGRIRISAGCGGLSCDIRRSSEQVLEGLQQNHEDLGFYPRVLVFALIITGPGWPPRAEPHRFEAT
jgi:hypothetical protein